MPTPPRTIREICHWSKRVLKRHLPPSLLRVYFSFYPIVGSIFFRHPSRELRVIGITGTDGKSSTVLFVARLLQATGHRIGYFSSVAWSDGGSESPNDLKMTMPGGFFLQSFLRRLVDNGCDIAVLEVTSEGIKQQRHRCIDFSVAVCTNLQPEHLESHGAFRHYKNAKSQIFRRAKMIVINGDDAEAREFLSFPAERTVTYGFRRTDVDVQGAVSNVGFDHQTLHVVSNNKDFTVTLPLGGPFAAANALAAVAVATCFEVDAQTIASVLEHLPTVPGRFEIVSRTPFVIVDYAHTIAAVEKLLSFLRSSWKGKIVHVFGAAGGGRDRWKRPRLAELSETNTDVSILTEENPFDEEPNHIVKDIFQGFRDPTRVKIFPRREDAVRAALDLADEKTLCIFASKGCETVIAGPLGRKRPYNERQAILSALGRH